MKNRGAQKNNTNALKHGFYSKQFRNSEIDGLTALKAAGHQDLASEIALLRVVIYRTLAQADLAASDPAAHVDWLSYLSALGLAATRIANLLRAQKILEGDQGEAVASTISLALQDIAKELKLSV